MNIILKRNHGFLIVNWGRNTVVIWHIVVISVSTGAMTPGTPKGAATPRTNWDGKFDMQFAVWDKNVTGSKMIGVASFPLPHHHTPVRQRCVVQLKGKDKNSMLGHEL